MDNNLREYKKKIVKQFMKNDILISPDFINSLNETTNIEQVKKLLKTKISENELNKLSEKLEIIFKDNSKQNLKEKEKYNRQVEVIFDFDKPQYKKKLDDFVMHYKNRYHAIEKMLMNRTELAGILPIHRILKRNDSDKVAIIGMIVEKKLTEKGNLIFTVEDPTGIIKVVVTQRNEELFNEAKDIVCDEVVGFIGTNGNKIVFANNVIWPDVPTNKEFKKSPDETYAIFLSDLHVGSREFLHNDFEKFITWINGNSGNTLQKDIAEKVKYIFIAGDLIAGVGIYPGQDEELDIKDLYEQYDKCAELLAKIPKRITLIISAGNHDALRLAEPQPKLYTDYAKKFYEMENVILISNPGIVNIHKNEDFPGFDVLMYHGYSFDYYVREVESIRNNGGYERADLIMKFLLKRRHLAPTHGSTLFVPDKEEDSHVIKTIPDFFITGHIHRCNVSHYKNITNICGSCWEGKTAFQEKTGHNPEPSRVPIVNLKTRQVKILKFSDDE
jgi:DNA polymerase II small subunit